MERRNTRVPEQALILDAAAVDGAGTEFRVTQYRHIVVAIVGTTLPTLTVKCQGSVLNTPPTDWEAAHSVTNVWDYIAMYDLQDGALVAGDTGVAFTGTADVRQFLINTDALNYLNFIVSGSSAGTVTVYVIGFNNL